VTTPTVPLKIPAVPLSPRRNARPPADASFGQPFGARGELLLQQTVEGARADGTAVHGGGDVH
jgi:hypothetical protein